MHTNITGKDKAKERVLWLNISTTERVYEILDLPFGNMFVKAYFINLAITVVTIIADSCWKVISLLQDFHFIVPSQQWKHLNNVQNLFKVNNKDTRHLVFLLLTLNRFLKLLWCFHCYFEQVNTGCITANDFKIHV